MFAGSGLQARPSAQIGVPLLEADLPLSRDTSAPVFSYEPGTSMLGSMVDEKPAARPAEKKKASSSRKGYGNEKQSNGKKSAEMAPAIAKSSTISLGEDPEAAQQRRSSKDGAFDMAAPSSGAAASAEGHTVGFANDRSIDEEAQRLIAKSWQELKEHEERCKNGVGAKKAEADDGAAAAGEGPGSAEGPQAGPKKSSGFWSKMSFGRSGKNQDGEASPSKETGKDKGKNTNKATLDIPQTFKEMCLLNAGMTGSNIKYIEVVESCFEKLVVAASSGDHIRLEVESNIMALRMHKDVQGKLNLSEFKTCMLASLRSLLPKSWSIAHEKAWSTMWDLVQSILTTTLPLPGKYEKAVDIAVADMSEEDKRTYGLNAFNRFFAKQPKAEDHFNTSNARLSVLAMHGLQMCQDIYKEPTRLVNVVTSLGLKHIMYNISIEYFDAFVESMVEEFECWAKDPNAVYGVEWALTQIAAIMIYTIKEGSNPLLQAVITNNAKKVKAALAPLAKKDRAPVCLGATGQVISTTDGDTRK